MTNNWQEKRLDEVASVTMGQSPPSSSYNDAGLGVPFFQGKPSNIDNFGVANPYQYTTEPTKVVTAGTALMTVRAPVGDIFTSPTDVCIGRGLSGIKANIDVSQKYLNYQLQFASQQFHTLSQGSTFTAINSSDLKGIQIGLPPLKVQQKIGDILTSIDEAIQKTDKIIQKSEELKNGLMNQLLTKGIGHKKFKKTKLDEIPEEWEIVELSTVALVERGKFSHRPRNDPKFYGGSIPFIQTGDVVNSKGRIKTYSQTLNEQGLSVSKIFPKGTIVLTIAANIGDTGILEFDACFPDSLVGIRPHSNVDSIFLEYFLKSRKPYLNSIATQSAQKNINLAKLNPMLVLLPPLNEQKKIAEILSSVDEEIIKNTFEKERLKALKGGLMQDIFSQKIQIN